MKKRLLPAVAATVITAMCLPAHAVQFSYSGFVNAIAGYTDAASVKDGCSYLKHIGYYGGLSTNKVPNTSTGPTTDPRLSTYVPLLYGCGGNIDPSYYFNSRRVNATDNTNMGFQVKADFNDSMSATMQMVTHGYDNFDINAAWAYLTYLPTDNVMVRVGRIRNPIFLLSENIEVGYTYPWIQTPQEVYGQVRVANLEGMVASYNNMLGDYDYSVSFFTGTTHTKLPYSGKMIETRLKDGFGANFEIGNDDYKIHIGYATTKFGMDEPSPGTAGVNDALDGLASTLSGFSGAGLIFDSAKVNQMVYNYKMKFVAKDQSGSFAGIGLSYDKDNIIIMGEYTKRQTNSEALPSSQGWYGLVGYRMGDFVPSFTIAGNKTIDNSKRSMNSLLEKVCGTWTSGGGSCNGALDSVISAAGGTPRNVLNNFIKAWNLDINRFTNYDTTNYSLGLRWNFIPGAALKGEWTILHANDGTPGSFDRVTEKATNNLYKIALEAVF